MKLLTLTILMLISVTFVTAQQMELYVSPDGSDSNFGKKEEPFKTIVAARDYLRKNLKKQKRDIVVYLREGNYKLKEPLVFTNQDGGKNGFNVYYKAYPNENVVISGGEEICNWTPYGEGIWKARTQLTDFRQIYVNGTRASRASGNFPKKFTLISEKESNKPIGYDIPSSEMSSWNNPEDIEVYYTKAWIYMFGKVAHILKQGNSSLVMMNTESYADVVGRGYDMFAKPDHIENAFELMDSPGEWYFDKKKKTVYYIPLPSEDILSAKVIAPNLERLLVVAGTLDNPVTNLIFEGLDFKYAKWSYPNKYGFVDIQANFTKFKKGDLSTHLLENRAPGESKSTPANVQVISGKHIVFSNCTFSKFGGVGIEFQKGAQNNIIEGCEFYDISCTGIQIGNVMRDDHHPKDIRFIVKGNVIRDSKIHNVANEFLGGVGVFIGYTDSTIVANNEIYNLPYTGISIGWGWGQVDAGGGVDFENQNVIFDTPTTSRNNKIINNHIHHTMLKLNDGGGIYILGNMDGSLFKGNYLHDNFISNGIYLDQGTGFVTVEENVIISMGQNPSIKFNNLYQRRDTTCELKNNYYNNYMDQYKRIYFLNNNHVFSNHVLTTTNIPDQVQSIIDNAGFSKKKNLAKFYILSYPNNNINDNTAKPINTNFKCGEVFIDKRNMKSYNTIAIGNQCWMKENLNIGVMVKSRQGEMHSDLSNNNVIEKYCYEDNEINCVERGALYTWDEAMQYDTIAGAQGVCPSGWHIPTVKDVEKLKESLSNMTELDEIKSNGQPLFISDYCDYRHGYGMYYTEMGFNAFWTSNDIDKIGTNVFFTYDNNKPPKVFSNYKTKGFSIRCIKD